MDKNSKWSPAEATTKIREIARSSALTISYKRHAIERMRERGLIVSDALYVLKNGFSYRDALSSTREGYHRYEMECKSPNGGSREVRVVVIPEQKARYLKIISIMWVDEAATIAGSIVGEEDV